VKKLLTVGARFLVIGALSTLIEIGVFNLCYLVFGWDVVVAKVVASLVALVNAYFGNREWAFRDRNRHRRWLELLLFLAVNGVCTVLGALILWGGTELLGEPGPFVVNIINLFSIGVVVLVRFVFYHFVVFRMPRATPDAPPVE
jgi:putative flippase GtrA